MVNRLLLIIVPILLIGCTASEVKVDNISKEESVEDVFVDKEDIIEDVPIVYDSPPLISKRALSPSNPQSADPFTLTINADDDIGIKEIKYSILADKGSFDCGMQKSCLSSWEIRTTEEGLHEISIAVIDSSGQEAKASMEVNVQPARKTTCGNNVCDTVETEETCPKDCYEPPLFACENGVCEGGESYESCPQDCSLSNIIGTTRGDGACEPGEDAKNSPKDCTVINPDCGNKICDSSETATSCSADCESSEEETPCNSDAECGYKKACQGGKCISVQCTSDSQCTGCRRCSSNRCVNCGYGAAGICTC